MYNFFNVIIYLVVVSFVINQGYGQRIKDEMYEVIKGVNACFRRLNATHQVGCSSERGGSLGVVHYCQLQDDLDFLFNNLTAAPYIPILPMTLFNRNNFNLMRKNEKISGLVLFSDDSNVENYSHEYQCPNPLTSLPNTCNKDLLTIWNPYGTSLLYENIPFPIFYLNNKENLESIRNCFNKYNNFSYDTQSQRSLCSLEIDAFMYAAVNTPTCLRRSQSILNDNEVKFCDPLGDQNIWATLFPLNNDNISDIYSNHNNNGKKYIILATHMDTTTMFDKTYGAQSPVTGLVAFLATVKLLKTILPQNNNYDKNILFVIFNGETYDYIGSQRFLYDLLNKEHDQSGLPPLKINDIDLFIEFSQLGQSDRLYAHYLNNDYLIKNFLKKLMNNTKLLIELSPNTLPPSSLHTFIKNDRLFPGILLADHHFMYSNKFYNSLYDNGTNIKYKYYNLTNDEPIPTESIQRWIGNISEMLSKTLYEIITNNKYPGQIRSDIEFINELFYCYLDNPNCKVHQAIQKIKFQNEPFNLYVGVDIVLNTITSLVGLTLGWITGDDIGESNLNCVNYRHNPYKLFNMSKSINELNSTRCFKTTLNFTDAISPAFIIKDYDWSSGVYSSWSESTWGDTKMRLYLKPSIYHELLTIISGLVIFILSLILCYFINLRSKILFTSSSPSSSINTPLPTNTPTDC